MPSTHTSLHYHIVFSTKDREPRISRNWESTLHKYLGGIIRNIGGKPISIGGIEDHVHLLIGLKPNQCISEVVRDIKSNSSSWVHDEGYSRSFAWQEGYGAFTVSPQMLIVANLHKRHTQFTSLAR